MANKSNITLGNVEPCIDYIKVYDVNPETGDKDKVFERESENYDIEIDISAECLAQAVAYLGASNSNKMRTFWKKLLKENGDILNNDLFHITKLSLESCMAMMERGSFEHYQMKATLELLRQLDENYSY